MTSEELIRNYLQDDLAISVGPGHTLQEMESLLRQYIDELISQDFGKLVAILYRIDVSETKLRQVLAEHEGEHSSELIAGLILQRQMEKIRSRERYGGKPGDSVEEKW